MSGPKKSYTHYEIVSLVAVPPGWRAAFREEDKSVTFLDIICMALATDEERECMTNRVIEKSSELHPYVVVGGDWLLEIAAKSENYIGTVGPNEDGNIT